MVDLAIFVLDAMAITRGMDSVILPLGVVDLELGIGRL